MFGKNSARINITVRNTIQRLEPITLNSQSCSQTQKQSDTVHSEEHNSPRGTKSLHNIRSCRSIMRQIQNTEVPHSLIQNLSQVQQWKKKNPVSHSCYQLHPNIALDGQVKKKKKKVFSLQKIKTGIALQMGLHPEQGAQKIQTPLRAAAGAFIKSLFAQN